MNNPIAGQSVTIPEAMQLAVQHQAAGRLPEAERICHLILQAQPNNVDALHFLGLLSHQRGDPVSAVKWIKQAIAILPQLPEAHCNLGLVFEASRNPDEAVRYYQRAIALKPDYVEAHYNLGNVWKGQGKLGDAIESYRRTLALNPAFVLGHFNLGIALEESGKHEEAARCYRQAIALNPSFADAHYNLGILLAASGDHEEAAACFRRAIELSPRHAAAHLFLGDVLQRCGHLTEAVACYKRAIAIKPDYVEGHNNLGSVLQSMGRFEEAIACYQRAIALQPDSAVAHNNLGHTLQTLGKLESAIGCFRRALQINPDFAEAHSNLGGIYLSQGRLDEAIACQQRALEIKPDFADAHSNLLYFLNYGSTLSASEIFGAHQKWSQQHAAGLDKNLAPFANSRDANRRLRIGYVSPDFRNHAVAHFASPVIEKHDKSRFEVFCYYNHTQRDEFTQRIESAADHWIPCSGMSDDQLAQRIRDDGIDILIDLAGHTVGNRLLVFARKPAPVQITYLGYPNTSGLSTMDYRITDQYADPPGSDAYYSEKLLCLPHSLCCYQAPPNMPDILPLPALQNGYVTFGSFNNFNKIRSQCIELWATLLRRLPGSRLLMMTVPEGEIRQRLIEQFSSLGVAPERLELHGKLALNDFHKMFRKMDIALDPFPLTGGTTTCETLWMGVPVVVLVGKRFISRVGYSFLSAVGRQEFSAETLEEYVKVALDLAADVDQLATTHAGLRRQVAASPLADAAGFTCDLENAYREVWKTWCAA